MADIGEVAREIREFEGLSMRDFETLRAKKADGRGGFIGRIVLEHVES